MKIGIVGSGFDMLGIFKLLSKYDFDYHIYFDWNNGYYGDKDLNFTLSNISKGVDYLLSKGVDFIILPPIYEYLIENNKILKLFSEYINNYIIKYSLIGKIGFVGDKLDTDNFQKIFLDSTKDYILSENQKSIKNFNFPFCIWNKDTSIWKYFLQNFSYRNFALSKIIKFDLKYLKDAGIDTLVPLNYGYFLNEYIIKNKLNTNKIRFYGIETLKECFENIINKNKLLNSEYNINIYLNGGKEQLLSEKKWIWLLQRGKSIKINFLEI